MLKKRFRLNFGFGKDIALDWGSKYCYTYDLQNGFKSYLSTVWVDEKSLVKAWGNVNQASVKKLKPLHLIKNGYLTDFKLCIDYIKFLLNEAQNRIELVKPTAWIAVNSNTHLSEIEGLDFVLKQAGFGMTNFVNQNLALALHHQYNFSKPKTQTFLHIGQQQTRLSTISPGGFILQKNTNFGAQNFDIIIENYVRRMYRMSVTNQDIETIKTLLDPKHQRTQIWGRDLVNDRIKNAELDYAEIWNHMKPALENLTDIIKEYIQNLPEEIINDLLDNGILVSGGGSIFGRISEYLQIKLNFNLFTDEEPRLAVVDGLRLILENKQAYLQSNFTWPHTHKNSSKGPS